MLHTALSTGSREAVLYTCTTSDFAADSVTGERGYQSQSISNATKEPSLDITRWIQPCPVMDGLEHRERLASSHNRVGATISALPLQSRLCSFLRSRFMFSSDLRPADINHESHEIVNGPALAGVMAVHRSPCGMLLAGRFDCARSWRIRLPVYCLQYEHYRWVQQLLRAQ